MKRLNLLLLILVVAIAVLIYHKTSLNTTDDSFIVFGTENEVPAPSILSMRPKDEKGPLPLLVILPDRGSNAEETRKSIEIQKLVGLKKFLAYLVDGNKKMGMRKDNQPAYEWGPSASSWLVKNLNRLLEKEDYLKDQVVLVGFSAGAETAYQTAVAYPDLFAGVIAISGYFSEAGKASLTPEQLASASRQIKISAYHGSNDHNIKPELGKAAVDFFVAQGFEARWEEFEGEHYLPGNFSEKVKESYDWIISKEIASPGLAVAED